MFTKICLRKYVYANIHVYFVAESNKCERIFSRHCLRGISWKASKYFRLDNRKEEEFSKEEEMPEEPQESVNRLDRLEQLISQMVELQLKNNQQKNDYADGGLLHFLKEQDRRQHKDKYLAVASRLEPTSRNFFWKLLPRVLLCSSTWQKQRCSPKSTWWGQHTLCTAITKPKASTRPRNYACLAQNSSEFIIFMLLRSEKKVSFLLMEIFFWCCRGRYFLLQVSFRH